MRTHVEHPRTIAARKAESPWRQLMRPCIQEKREYILREYGVDTPEPVLDTDQDFVNAHDELVALGKVLRKGGVTQRPVSPKGVVS